MNFIGGKGRPARPADNSAIVLAPNVKIRMETQHAITRLILHDLLRESFTLIIIFVKIFV